MNNDEISKQPLGNDAIVINPGKVMDNSNANEMLEIICSAQAEGRNNIILDLSNLEFLSSAGVGSIIGSIETSREAGGDIILCGVSDKIRHILEVLDLEDYLSLKPSVQNAIAFIKI